MNLDIKMEAIKTRNLLSTLGLFCFLGLNIIDSIITWQGLSIGALEVNWYAFLFNAIPVQFVLILKMAIAGLFAFLIFRYRKSLFKFLNVGMALIVVFNIISLIVTRAIS